MEEAPVASATQAAPFLVLLDETAFREYGTGERLEARLALENLDLGEDPDAALPYRTDRCRTIGYALPAPLIAA